MIGIKPDFVQAWLGLASILSLARQSEDALTAELAAAGFEDIRSEQLAARENVDRETALERLRGRHISTFDLLDPDEVERGVAQAERELPETVEIRLEQLIVTARRIAR